ncbi:MAG: hypothetical protein WC586_10420 [Methanoregula sp.]
METGLEQEMYAGRSSLTPAGCKDGIQEQVALLNELSEKLDEYFALRTFGPDDGRVG